MADPNCQRVAVVGGGLGGLAAACVLAARGYAVELFERNEWLGGKAAVYEKDGYRFDMGPTILTLPSVLRRIFGEADRELAHSLKLEELDPQWRCFFDDGTSLDLVSDTESMAAALEDFGDHDELGEGYRDFIAESEDLHCLTDEYFFWRPVSTFSDMVGGGAGSWISALGAFRRMKIGRTMAGRVRHYLTDPRVAQMADHFTQYVGSSPFQAPAILCGIAHMQTEEGIWYPVGGIRAVPEALEGLAGELGVQMHTDTEVSRIEVENGAARGLKTEDGRRFDADAIVCNEDCVLAHRELVGGSFRDRFLNRRTYEPACSGVVLYLGLDRRYDQLLHHNFVFSRDAREEFNAIYVKGRPAPDPTCYVCAPARTDDTAAPRGCEALYVLVHTPYVRAEHEWTEMFAEYRERILDKLEKTAGLEDIRDHIAVEHALTPEGIRDRYNVLSGAIYGLASHGRLTGALKPNNRSPDVGGLYMAGGSVHPGPGMPIALMSGWSAGDGLDRYGVVQRAQRGGGRHW